jgi:hypothetical protein
MIVKYDNNVFIGDFIGTLPGLLELVKQDTGSDTAYLTFPHHVPDYKHQLIDMLPKKYKISISNPTDLHYIKHFTFGKAYKWLEVNPPEKGFMVNAFYASFDLTAPEEPVKVELELNEIHNTKISADYALAPFSTSRSNHELWPQNKWQELVNSFPDKTFMLIGSAKENGNYVTGPNVINFMGRSMQQLAWALKSVKLLIAIIAGPQHFAFPLSVPTLILSSQKMRWGINPDATEILVDNVPDISVEQVIETIRNIGV